MARKKLGSQKQMTSFSLCRCQLWRELALIYQETSDMPSLWLGVNIPQGFCSSRHVMLHLLCRHLSRLLSRMIIYTNVNCSFTSISSVYIINTTCTCMQTFVKKRLWAVVINCRFYTVWQPVDGTSVVNITLHRKSNGLNWRFKRFFSFERLCVERNR